MTTTPELLDDDLWRWTARHPEWHPAGFGDEVASFALSTDGEVLVLDPQLPSEPEPVLELVDELAQDGIAILITMPYHVRSAEQLRHRYGKRCTIWGHEACAKRLSSRTGFHSIAPGDQLPAGVTVHAIGRPRRQEQPLWIPSRQALVFGDAVVGIDGGLRVWDDDLVDERRTRWYRDRFVPTLEPLLELDPERVLVTHGTSVLADGRAELASALQSQPWNRRAR